MGLRIGFIGLGNMGGALVRGLSAGTSHALCGFDPQRELGRTLEKECGFTPLSSAAEVAAGSEYVFLAVKPQLMEQVVKDLAPGLGADHCLISIAAGIPIKSITEWSANACPVVRVMPNAPAMTGGGVFGLSFDHERLRPKQKETVRELFSSIGQAHVLSEAMLDVFTALVGSGPAFVLYCMEAFIDAGVTFGLPRAQVADMVVALFAGTADMARTTGTHVTLLKEMVTSPGGTTIAGLGAMDKAGVKAGLHRAVQDALARCRELG